jgi:hypothetical protein
VSATWGNGGRIGEILCLGKTGEGWYNTRPGQPPRESQVPRPTLALARLPPHDQDLRDIAYYLENGVRPVSHRMPDSEGPPDFWASDYTPDKIGAFPLAAFPSGNEVAMR